MGFKVIGRKNGKKTVSDNPENDATKVTKALEFLTVAEPSAATEGSTVRFMWNPQTGTSLCWIQGEVVKAVNPNKKTKKDKDETNRVTVKNLVIADCWGEEYNKKLPKTMTVDLNRRQTWALGTEVTLDTKGENEVFEVDMDQIPKVIEYCDDDTEDTQEEKGATGGVPVMNLSDNKRNQNTQIIESVKNSPTDETSDDESLCDEEEVGEARRLRNLNINEWLTDVKVNDILERVQSASQINRNRSNEIARTVGDAINNAQMGMDQAFIAGALAAHAGVARKDSLEHSQQISKKDVIEAATKARTYLKEAIKKVKTLAEEEFEKLRLWLESDEDTFIITSDHKSFFLRGWGGGFSPPKILSRLKTVHCFYKSSALFRPIF